MSLQSHLVELERKRRSIDGELNEAIMHPSSDDLRITELKRRKLHLKDEIERLKGRPGLH